jgi:hypothetical protein
MKLQQTAAVLFLLNAAIIVFFFAQIRLALAAMNAEDTECPPAKSRGRSWTPFVVAFAAGGAANVFGKGLGASQPPVSSWDYARRDLIGKLHASM